MRAPPRRGARHVTLLPLAGIVQRACWRCAKKPSPFRDCFWDSRLFLCACSLNLRAGTVRGGAVRGLAAARAAVLVPSTNLLGQRHDEPTTGANFRKKLIFQPPTITFILFTTLNCKTRHPTPLINRQNRTKYPTNPNHPSFDPTWHMVSTNHPVLVGSICQTYLLHLLHHAGDASYSILAPPPTPPAPSRPHLQECCLLSRTHTRAAAFLLHLRCSWGAVEATVAP
jgi:hypothetical protein